MQGTGLHVTCDNEGGAARDARGLPGAAGQRRWQMIGARTKTEGMRIANAAAAGAAAETAALKQYRTGFVARTCAASLLRKVYFDS